MRRLGTWSSPRRRVVNAELAGAAFASWEARAELLGAVGRGQFLGHGGGRSAGKLRGFYVGPGQGGGEARDDGGELVGVGAGDAVEFFGEDAADGGPFLLGAVLEPGDVMAREADAELGGAEGVREDAAGIVAERFFDEVEGPGRATLGECARAQSRRPRLRHPSAVQAEGANP